MGCAGYGRKHQKKVQGFDEIHISFLSFPLRNFVVFLIQAIEEG